MNFCPHCGSKLNEVLVFCPHCGNKLPKFELTSESSSPAKPEIAVPKQAVVEEPQKKPSSKKRVLLALTAILLCVSAMGLLLFTPFAGNFADNPDAIRNASESVVLLSCYDYYGIPYASGSGFAALDDGIIVTNYHVIEGNTYSVKVTTESGQTYQVDSILTYDKDKDIAILKVEDCHLDLLPLGNTAKLEKGQKVVAIGSPLGYMNTVTTGLFSNFWDMGLYDIIQFSASISPGSSGGALFDHKGKVIGITTAMETQAQDIYHAVTIDDVRNLYENRTSDNELTVEKLYNQSAHSYPVDYILNNPFTFNGKSVTVEGYVSGIDFSNIMYLVSSPTLVNNIDRRKMNITDKDYFDLSYILYHQYSTGISMEVRTKNSLPLPSTLTPGDYVSIVGTVHYYTDNASFPDILLEISTIQVLS